MTPEHKSQSRDEPSPAWLTRERVFARSYDEVLTALKHQDDKLNRTLTAIAFLTAAGVALFARMAARPLRFPESDWSISAFLFGVFLLATALALALALAAIGPSTPYRSASRTKDEDGSLLYYWSIADDPRWDRYLSDPPEQLVRHAAQNLHREAKLLADRTIYKVVRSRESGAFLQLAILALALLGIFSLEPFSLSTRWWISTALLVAFLMAPFHDLAAMWFFRFTRGVVSWWSYAAIGAISLSGIWLLARAPGLGQHWPALGYTLFALAVARLALAYTPRLTIPILGTVAVIGAAIVGAVEF